MAKSWFSIRAVSEAAAEIHIYDEIGYWGISARDFLTELQALGPVQNITVAINSPGGDVFDGFVIYNALKRHGATITTRIDGVAASAASFIAMAGDTVLMPENAFLMIHNPMSLAGGNADDLRGMADMLDQVRQAMVGIYHAKTGLDDIKIIEMLDAETWLSALDAVALGFADAIEAPVKLAARFDKQLFNRFRHPPEALLAEENPMTEPVTPAAVDPADIPAVPAIEPTPDPVADPAEIVNLCVSAGLIDLAEGFIRDQAPIAAVQARIAHASAVRDLCALAKAPERAAEFIRAQTPETDVRAALLDALAESDAATVNNQIPPDATPLSAAELAARAAEYVAEQSRKGITVSYARAVRHIQQGA